MRSALFDPAPLAEFSATVADLVRAWRRILPAGTLLSAKLLDTPAYAFTGRG
jgi:hypothetical protein